MLKLDKNRPYAVLFDGERQMQFHYQDYRMFDMRTDDEVDLISIPVKPKPAITCKFCNAKRETAELMHEHLIAVHGFRIAQDEANKEKAEPERQLEPKSETATVEEKAEVPAPKKIKETKENAK